MAQLAIGTTSVSASKMAFADQVKKVASELKHLDKEHERINQETDKHVGDCYDTNWGEDGATITYEPNGRDRPHRPSVDRETMKALDDALNQAKPTIPTDALTFEDKLKIALDESEKLQKPFGLSILPAN
jgi:hypothetical protein